MLTATRSPPVRSTGDQRPAARVSCRDITFPGAVAVDRAPQISAIADLAAQRTLDRSQRDVLAAAVDEYVAMVRAEWSCRSIDTVMHWSPKVRAPRDKGRAPDGFGLQKPCRRRRRSSRLTSSSVLTRRKP